MDTEKEKTFFALLGDRKDCVFRLLRLSNDFVPDLEDAEKAAELYSGFVDTRDGIIGELKEKNAELERFYLENPGFRGSDEAAAIEKDIKRMAGQIVRLERELNDKAGKIQLRLKKEIKDLNDRRRICAAYDKSTALSE